MPGMGLFMYEKDENTVIIRCYMTDFYDMIHGIKLNMKYILRIF